MFRSVIRLVLPVGLLAAAAGCSDSGLGTLRGKVTLDGTPVPDGAIFLYPVNNDTRTASCMIADSGFEVQLPATTYRVVISSPKTAATAANFSPTTDDGPAVSDRIPAKYNKQSELTVTVMAGDNEMNFDLKSDVKQ